jgi:exodeoxyribonuclease VII small subunit
MTDESYSFSTARNRLEEIVTQVRKKDTSLEKSLDLLEEGVRLANACTELIDHADWGNAVPVPAEEAALELEATGESETSAEESEAGIETVVVDGVAVIEDVVIEDANGEFVAEVVEVTEFYDAADDFDDAEDAWADESVAPEEPRPEDPESDEG